MTISVKGAQSYIAVAMPYSEYADATYYAEMIPMYYADGEVFGKMYNDTYTGSLLDVANGTTYSQSGLYQPNWKFYLIVMPIDGRPADAYTVENVSIFEFETSSLAAGGSVAATAEQVYEYMGEVFSWDDYKMHPTLIELDPMTQPPKRMGNIWLPCTSARLPLLMSSTVMKSAIVRHDTPIIPMRWYCALVVRTPSFASS